MKRTPKFLNLLFIIVALASMLQCAPQQNIMDSNNIQEIEAYLAQAHPEDPKKRVLHSKLIALKNADWVKGAKNAKPMAARPLVAEKPMEISNVGFAFHEKEEYEKLLLETPTNHNSKTTQLLNTVFNSDVSNNEAILLFQNKSDCNIIVRIKGEITYNLPVPSHTENSIVVKYGKYEVESNICAVKYSSSKNISKSQVIAINNAVPLEPTVNLAVVKVKKKNTKPVKKKGKK